MRAHEFITEVVSLKGAPPTTQWKGDVDTEGDRVDVGAWKDNTGREVRNIFQKDGKGGATLYFDRETKSGTPSFQITHSGKGASPAIMGGVVQNIQTYLAQNPDVKSVSFSSNEASRTRLYNAMIDRLAPQLKLVGTSSYDDGLERTTYNLRPAQSGEQHQPLKTIRPKKPVPPPPPPRDPNAKPVDLTRPPRNRPTATTTVKPTAVTTVKPVMPKFGGGGGAPLKSPKDMSPTYHQGNKSHIDPVQIDPLGKLRF